MSDITLTNFEPVRVNGWWFAATLETTQEGNIISSLPEQTIPSRYRSSGCVCEHCNLSRSRTNTYVVTNGTDYKQVGKSCLADFVGSKSTERLAQRFAFYGEIFRQLLDFSGQEARTWEGGGVAHAWTVTETVARTIARIREFGWVSSRTAEERMLVPTKTAVQMEYSRIRPTEEDYENADKAVDYFASLAETSSDFEHNLSSLCRAGFHSVKAFGFVCAIWVSYKSALDRVEREANQAARRERSQHVGEVGKRQEFTATIKRITGYPGDYGYVTITIMEDADGNVLVGKAILADAKEGQTVRFIATVKEHGERDGVKQTKLLRAAKAVLVGEEVAA